MTNKPEDDKTFQIGGLTVEVMDTGDGLGEAISKLLKQKFAGRDRVRDLRHASEQALENHLNSVDDDEAHALTDAIWNVCKDHATGNVLMALAQTVANVICERADPDEVRATVAASPLTPEQKERALEQGLHEAECWNCFNDSVSVRLGAFGLLANKIAAANTGMQPDAPDDVKATMKAVTDIVEGRDPNAKHH